MSEIDELRAENVKLKLALAQLIAWAGVPAQGPDWATPKAKKRNLEMCNAAVTEAYLLLPNGLFPGDVARSRAAQSDA